MLSRLKSKAANKTWDYYLDIKLSRRCSGQQGNDACWNGGGACRRRGQRLDPIQTTKIGNFMASNKHSNPFEIQIQTHSSVEGITEIKCMQTECEMGGRTERYAGAKSARRLLGKPGLPPP